MSKIDLEPLFVGGCIRSDNGSEFINEYIKRWLQEKNAEKQSPKDSHYYLDKGSCLCLSGISALSCGRCDQRSAKR